jgi:uroporphyrinogen III methyltransferase / synthase
MRIVVTRAAEQAAPLVARLQQLGHEVVLCPVIEIEPLAEDAIDVTGYDWVVVTSRNGASELARRRTGEPRAVAAIGPGTAETLRAHGLEPAVVAETSTQEGLLAVLPHPAGRVLVAAAEGARHVLSDGLDAEFLPLYRTRELEPPNPPTGDLAVLASASAARAFGRLTVGMPVVSIGPETTRAAREAGLEVVREADPHTLAGLVEAVAEAAVRLPPCSSAS